MSSDAKVLEYALVGTLKSFVAAAIPKKTCPTVTTASSRNHTTSELRAKYSENGRTHSLSIPMTVADYAGKMEVLIDGIRYLDFQMSM